MTRAGPQGSEAALRSLRIVWSAIMATPALLVVALLVAPVAAAGSEVDPQLPLVLGFAAVSSGLASLVLPGILLRQGLATLKVETRSVDDPSSIIAGTKVDVAADPKSARLQIARIYQTHVIIGMALAESVALFGFVLKYLGFGWEYALPLMVASWVLMAARFPRLEPVFAQVEKSKGIRLEVPRS